MKWYGFVARFWLILGLFFNLGNIGTAFEENYVIFARLTTIGVFLLNIVALIQLNKRRWTGVLAFLGMWGLLFLTDIYAILRGFFMGMELGFEVFSVVVTRLVFIWLNWIYFSKRRLLFLPLPEWYKPGEPDIETPNEM